YELAWGLRWQQQKFTVNLDVFASYLPNYLHRTRVGTTIPPLPPATIVYGYRSTEAAFLGGELEVLWQPATDTWWRLAATGVEGTDRTAHRRLPEIPPATLALAAGRIWPGAGLKPWVEFGLRAAAAQHNPAPDEMPVFANTPEFTLGNIRGGLTWRSLRIALSVENVFGRLYYDYLTPPAGAAPASGTLRPGARIPGPGRTITLTLSYGLP
ncbi:MAG: TonB-dependent receptor, partial [Opitutaceae bacterium]